MKCTAKIADELRKVNALLKDVATNHGKINESYVIKQNRKCENVKQKIEDILRNKNANLEDNVNTAKC